MERKSFLDQEAPIGYIAGIGRGAIGFTTSAEWGKITQNRANIGKIPESNGLETEDLEADDIFDSIESQLAKKRPKKKQKRIQVDANGVQVEDITLGDSIKSISNKFKDAKNELKDISIDEWTNLPAPIDLTMRNKRLREERKSQLRFYRNSDGVSLSMLNQGETDEMIDFNDNNLQNDDLNRAKDLVLDSHLKLKGEELSHDNIDKYTYLSKLSKSNKSNDDDQEVNKRKVLNTIGDYSKTKTLFNKLIKTNPYKPENWIAFARLEYDAKKYSKSREIIQSGCEMCPKYEEIWLVNLELNESNLKACKVIVADSIKYLNKSLKLWLKAIEFESDILSKTRVIRKALEFIPENETLWLELVEIEPNVSIKIKILEKASQLVPKSLKIWLLWSDLDEPNEGLKILAKSREFIEPKKLPIIWISQAKIQEKIDENELKIDNIITKCFDSINTNEFKYEDWLIQCRNCDKDGFKLVTKLITLKTLEKFDPSIDQILQDCDQCKSEGCFQMAKSMLFYINFKYPEDLNSWFDSISLAKEITTDDDGLYITYELALKAQPNCIQLYLMYAKDKWVIDNDISKARDIIFEGMNKNKHDEDLWFAAIKLEFQSGSSKIAIDLFDQCLNQLENPSSRVWIKYVTLLRKVGDQIKSLEVVNEGLRKFPVEKKLYIQKGQIYENMEEFELARETYEFGTKKCPNSAILWIQLAKLYQFKLKKIMKARSVLDESIGKNPTCEILYYEKIKMEWTNKNLCFKLISKGLKMIPKSGLIWSLQIKIAENDEKKTVYGMALKSTRDDPNVILTIAIDLWKRDEIPKAKIFFESCLKKNPDFGDLYIHYYAYLLQNGEMDEMKQLEKVFLKNDPHNGLEWCMIIKDIENLDIEPLNLLRKNAIKVL